MSLINDALKQARRSQQNNPPSIQPPLPPVESVSRGGMNWFLLVAIVLLLAVAGFFIGLSLTKHTPQPPATAPPPMLATAPEPLPIQPAESVSNSTPVVTNTPSVSNEVADVPPPPPEPKLQGILFDPTRPCAIVDGTTVFVGDRAGEFRVTAISKDKVTLKSGTETKVLRLDR
jgi:hypothetical protein